MIPSVQSFCCNFPNIVNLYFYLQQGDAPLLMATQKGMVDIVKMLLDRGADSSSKDKVNNQS